MNIEELKGVITVVADLGDGATAVAYTIVGTMMMETVISYSVGIFALALFYKILSKGIETAQKISTIHMKLKRLRDQCKIGRSGRLTDIEVDIMAGLIKKGQHCQGGHD